MANKKKAGIQRKIEGNAIAMEEINRREAIMSIALNKFPVIINKPLRKRRPEQNNRNGVKTGIPNTNIIKATDDAKSMAPNSFTSMKFHIIRVNNYFYVY